MSANLKQLCKTLQKPKVQKWMTYIGLFLINLPGGVAIYYGNLLTYTASYLRLRVSEDVTHYIPVMITVWALLFSVALIFSKKVSSRCGTPLTMLLGIVTYDFSTLLGLWTVQHSVLAQTFTQGVMSGTGLVWCIRNIWLSEKCQIISPDNQTMASFADVKQIYKEEKNCILKTTPLTQAAVNPSRLQLQNVQHACTSPPSTVYMSYKPPVQTATSQASSDPSPPP
ncbi:uncharacterized protein LOC118477403 [Aplysia californica]|uniref:Uncharacterized protein LOC118477403 n=1 Tax=Aplysia californica TaxID=6500 RepID=A0ABM1VQK6_APLCA|nr:uncharacterized protein LOC118477403 [Aplysia californica]